MADVSPLSRVRELSKAVAEVAENIAMSRRRMGRFKTFDRAAMVRQAAQPFTRRGVSTDLYRPARGPSADRQQPGSAPASRPLQLPGAAL
jgi:hypothetical protein